MESFGGWLQESLGQRMGRHLPPPSSRGNSGKLGKQRDGRCLLGGGAQIKPHPLTAGLSATLGTSCCPFLPWAIPALRRVEKRVGNASLIRRPRGTPSLGGEMVPPVSQMLGEGGSGGSPRWGGGGLHRRKETRKLREGGKDDSHH